MQETNNVKVKVNIDPCNLFHRLILIGERTDTVKDCFAYELTPYPMSLFKDSLMREPDKPSLFQDLLIYITIDALATAVQNVVDGGY